MTTYVENMSLTLLYKRKDFLEEQLNIVNDLIEKRKIEKIEITKIEKIEKEKKIIPLKKVKIKKINPI